MSAYRLQPLARALGGTALAISAVAVDSVDAALPVISPWQVVLNNGDCMPTDDPPTLTCRRFNSYNQPSVNANQVVVIRARSKGGPGGELVGAQPIHGVYMRDMAAAGPVVKILDRNTLVPDPNNLDTVFGESPSFPRIDIGSDTMATRGNHQPVWKYTLNDSSEARAGTTGIYTNPFESLITGASKLGAVPEFSFFQVPEAPGIPFDVFPGAPAVTHGTTIIFKGNYTVAGKAKTGVYYRNMANAPMGGTNPVVLIANNTDTLIPGTKKSVFGSTAPPSAAITNIGSKGKPMAVFAGFDDEEHPTRGGIYLAPLTPYNLHKQPALIPLVQIGQRVPGENLKARFNKLGEGVSFDGRFVAFWGAWGTETKTLVLQCPEEGNAERIKYCKDQHPGGYEATVPVYQGIFVHDIQTRLTWVAAKTPKDFDDFVYWNFSGRTPGTGEGDDDGELARWRSASFIAVSGLVDGSPTDPTFHVAFKARTGKVATGTNDHPVHGIYLSTGPWNCKIGTVVETGMDGTLIDPEAVYTDEVTGQTLVLPVSDMGLEREGFRGDSLAISVSMGKEEAGWAGVYLTKVHK